MASMSSATDPSAMNGLFTIFLRCLSCLTKRVEQGWLASSSLLAHELPCARGCQTEV
jgi:hypothetical protein